MIRNLYIKNFALIDELEVEFDEGLNILTGQTGAGKSIIVGALNMILGERADTDQIRQGANKAIAEASIFVGEVPSIRELLEDNAVEYSEELILRREIRSSGSRAFINDTPVTISILKQVGDQLVDLHGQHEHQLLLQPEHHREVVDAFEEIQPLMESYLESYREMQELREKRQKLSRRESELREKRELYEFQVQELEEAKLTKGEDEELETELNLLDNAEELQEKVNSIVDLGSEAEINLMDLLNQIKIQLEDIARIEPEFEGYLEELSSARISLQEMIRFTEEYREDIEFNPQRLDYVRGRLNEINRLKKKYQRDIDGLLEYLEETRQELDLAENFEAELEQMDEAIDEQADILAERARELHEKRTALGDDLSDDIVRELQQLGMPNARFEIRVEWRQEENGWIEIDGQPVECTEHGADFVEFYISTNKGEDPLPLYKIASGGEISRVMLALKSIIAKEQSLPVMIFDEIDAGISGKISEKVGKTMRMLSDNCQIIAITHQPQIASQAHAHYQVEKVEDDGRMITRITPLSDEEHVKEVASLMSGEQITQATLKSARELIHNAVEN
mgnify:CR=1 FL=1